MSVQHDYYQVLGLSKGCTPQEVKKNYHQLALKYHPDKYANKQEAEIKFNEIHNAYSILGNKSKRTIYDNYGQEGLDFEDKCDNFATNNSDNAYYQKGFQGGEKSAFDLLKDILQGNDEDTPKNQQYYTEITDNMKSKLASFINDNFDSSEDEDDDGDPGNFCNNYVPTFMNASFNQTFISLSNSHFNTKSESTDFFNFSFQTTANENAFSKAKTTDTSRKTPTRKQGPVEAYNFFGAEFDDVSEKKESFFSSLDPNTRESEDNTIKEPKINRTSKSISKVSVSSVDTEAKQEKAKKLENIKKSKI